ncbi:hypothetical protein ACTXT7_013253 [Hymenolepis weldensis]
MARKPYRHRTSALLFVCETIIGIFFFVYRESAMNRIEEVVKKTFISQYREIGFEDSTNYSAVGPEAIMIGRKIDIFLVIQRTTVQKLVEYLILVANNNGCVAGKIKAPINQLHWAVVIAVYNILCNGIAKDDISYHNLNIGSLISVHYPTENVINTSCGHGVQNLSPPQASPLVWTVGCVQALASLLESNVVPVSCAISGIAVLQLLAILLAKALYTQIGDQLRLLQHEGPLR